MPVSGSLLVGDPAGHRVHHDRDVGLLAETNQPGQFAPAQLRGEDRGRHVL